MSFWDFLKTKPVPTNELQAELKALCRKVVAQQFPYSQDMRRYEELLKEIYLRGVEPEDTLIPK